MAAVSLADRFRRFGERECAHVSPLYAQFSACVAEDMDLLAIASAGDGRSQPVPNLFFAALHYLLLGGVRHGLEQHYPAVGGDPTPTAGACVLLRDFCRAHADAIRDLLTKRLVQTNEVRRCALTMPVLARAAMDRPIALIEVGASAGLNLLLDQYCYRYRDPKRGLLATLGDPQSPVLLSCEVRGVEHLIPTQLPQIAWRLGLDLNPIQAHDHDATRWLRALIWPEQRERADLLRHALQLAERTPPTLWAGDAIELLPRAFAAAPAELMLCVVHTFTLNQFSASMRARFDELLAAESSRRQIAVVGIEWREPMPPVVLTSWAAGVPMAQQLATCDPHGAWIAA